MDEKISILLANVENVIYGKRNVILQVIAAILSNGHVLIEDVPGVGKTKLVSSLAKSLAGDFNRVQLTPDVMPSDITGYVMIDPESKKLKYQRGAAITNFLLVDEINRASPKVQSALLEVMEERQISIDSNTIKLPEPFIVFATQNPVENYGTYHLPEAQLDRFLIKISVGYPDPANEMRLLEKDGNIDIKEVKPVLSLQDILDLQEKIKSINVDQSIQKFIIDIALATRENEHLTLGLSPRASLALNTMSKAVAYINGRSYVIPDDIIMLSPTVLSHRIILSSKGKGYYQSNEEAIEAIVRMVEMPSNVINY